MFYLKYHNKSILILIILHILYIFIIIHYLNYKCLTISTSYTNYIKINECKRFHLHRLLYRLIYHIGQHIAFQYNNLTYKTYEVIKITI